MLTLRELNRALLARQLLLSRARLPVPRAIERLGALQAQWPPSPYVALWSRLDGFARDHLTRALVRRHVVKATLMRQTLHIISRADYPHVGAALRRAWRHGGLKWLTPEARELDVAPLAARVAEAAAVAPRTRAQLLELIAADVPEDAPEAYPWSLLIMVHAHADLVHTPESGFWRTTGSPRYVPAATVLGTPRRDVDPEEGVTRLVRRHLAAFGPATRPDVASWTGLPVSVVGAALERLRHRTFRDERGRTLVDLTRQSLPAADVRAPVRFLPKWDSALLAYEPTGRERILPERYRKTVVQRNGDVAPTLLVDGFVAGTWRVERAKRKVTLVVEALEPLPRAARDELADEAERLARFVEPDAPAYAVRLA